MLTYTIQRVKRCCFTRIGYEVQILRDGFPYAITYKNAVGSGTWQTSEPLRFYGDDGRKVRAEAVRWAKAQTR